jgi:voltage-gated potassium channel
LICMVFVWDFVRRLHHVRKKSRFWLTHGYEILAMIPAVAFFPIAHLIAVTVVLRTLRLVRVVLIVFRALRFMHLSSRIVQRSHLVYLAIAYLSIVFIGAIVELALEEGIAGSQINNFPDAIWVSVSMVTAVGFGNLTPVSAGGRAVGMILMISGTIIVSMLVGFLSASLVEARINRREQESHFKKQLKSHIKEEIDHIDKLNDKDVTLLIKMIETLHKEEKDKFGNG